MLPGATYTPHPSDFCLLPLAKHEAIQACLTFLVEQRCIGWKGATFFRIIWCNVIDHAKQKSGRWCIQISILHFLCYLQKELLWRDCFTYTSVLSSEWCKIVNTSFSSNTFDHEDISSCSRRKKWYISSVHLYVWVTWTH